MIESAEGKMENVITFRLPLGTDVLAGIIDMCEARRIKDGVVISALGSWRKVSFCNLTKLSDGKVGYGAPTVLKGNYELLSLSGMICHDADGNIMPHIHLMCSDEQGNAHGGHMLPGCEVALTTDVVIGAFTGIDMGRRFDEDLAVALFSPKKLQ